MPRLDCPSVSAETLNPLTSRPQALKPYSSALKAPTFPGRGTHNLVAEFTWRPGALAVQSTQIPIRAFLFFWWEGGKNLRGFTN